MAKTNIQEVRNLIESHKKTGIELTDDQLRQISAIEDQYVKEEVLPALEQLLQQIPRPLSLTINYNPDAPLSAQIFRDSDIPELQENVQPTLPADEVPGYNKRDKPYQRTKERDPDKSLIVTFPDGTVFKENKAAKTFCKVIEHIGVERVRSLNIKEGKVIVVSTTNDPNRRQRQIGNFYIFTNTSTVAKANILQQISDRLSLSLKIEVND